MSEWFVNKEDLPKGIVEFDELMCGCGQPQICWNILFTYLEHCASEPFYHNTENPFELFFMYVVDHLKLTEHGTSIYGAWVTDKGKEVLIWLRQNIDKINDLIICY